MIRIVLINRMAFKPRFAWRKGMWKRRGIGWHKSRQLEDHCRFAHHALPDGFEPGPGVSWHMVHHLLHRLEKGWGR